MSFRRTYTNTCRWVTIPPRRLVGRNVIPAYIYKRLIVQKNAARLLFLRSEMTAVHTMTIFETPRLLVRSCHEGDFAPIFQLQSDANVMRYIRAPVTEEQPVRERMAMWADYALKCPGLGVFTLEDRETGVFVGYAVARHANFNTTVDEYEVGYTLAPAFWGQGLVSELVPYLCRYLFEIRDTPYIVAFTDPENAASKRVLVKSGFVEVGTRNIYDGISTEFRLAKT